MKYPAIYNAHEIDEAKQGPMIREGRIPRGEPTSKCLIKVSDALADRYGADPDIEIVNEAKADVWLAQNPQLAERPQEEVLSPERLTAILAKTEAGIALSQEDLDALDPNSPVRGINKVGRTCAEIFP